jgi:hypothetical protein
VGTGASPVQAEQSSRRPLLRTIYAQGEGMASAMPPSRKSDPGPAGNQRSQLVAQKLGNVPSVPGFCRPSVPGFCPRICRPRPFVTNTPQACMCYVWCDQPSQIGHDLTFVDLFCGIGGMRLGFEHAGCRCVFSSDWDKYAQQTYAANFGEITVGNIREIDSSSIPDHDILVGGFPCQPFSISGVSKKNSLGRAHGFADKTQGTLFFEVARIINDKRPAAFLLENVKHLVRHDKGRTMETILETLSGDLGYHVYEPKVLDARHVVPQQISHN